MKKDESSKTRFLLAADDLRPTLCWIAALNFFPISIAFCLNLLDNVMVRLHGLFRDLTLIHQCMYDTKLLRANAL